MFTNAIITKWVTEINVAAKTVRQETEGGRSTVWWDSFAMQITACSRSSLGFQQLFSSYHSRSTRYRFENRQGRHQGLNLQHSAEN